MATEQELEKMINDLYSQINLLQLGQNHAVQKSVSEEENTRIEKYLSDFTTRQGVLLTVAGLLLVLLPNSDIVVKHLLLWSVPFLLLAVGFYIMSAKRVHFVALNNAHVGTPEDMNPLLREIYFASTKYHKWADIFLVIFFSSFTLQLYNQVFHIVESQSFTLIITTVAVLIGCLRYFYISSSYMSPSLFAHNTGGTLD